MLITKVYWELHYRTDIPVTQRLIANEIDVARSLGVIDGDMKIFLTDKQLEELLYSLKDIIYREIKPTDGCNQFYGIKIETKKEGLFNERR